MKTFTVKAWSPVVRQMIVIKLNAENEAQAKEAAKAMGLRLIVVHDGDTPEQPGGEPPPDSDQSPPGA